jgi:hypothetical protein
MRSIVCTGTNSDGLAPAASRLPASHVSNPSASRLHGQSAYCWSEESDVQRAPLSILTPCFTPSTPCLSPSAYHQTQGQATDASSRQHNFSALQNRRLIGSSWSTWLQAACDAREFSRVGDKAVARWLGGLKSSSFEGWAHGASEAHRLSRLKNTLAPKNRVLIWPRHSQAAGPCGSVDLSK